MKLKVTVQDIADALQLSRITVSKVLNNSPNVSDETRALVLKKAQEMNYKHIAANKPNRKANLQAKSFAFVMHMTPDAFHIGSGIITQLEQEIRIQGYSLTLHSITDDDIASLTLPPNLNRNQTAAIVCLELFHPEYSRLLCSLGIPVLFIDACTDFYSLNLGCILLMMENRNSTCHMLSALCREHSITSMGFVGDFRHCISFRERYESFLLTALEYGAETSPYNLIADDRFYSQDGWMTEQLKKMNRMPQLFFCANDVLAHILIQALAELGLQAPRDIMVCGFDGIPSMNTLMNSLTTIHIPCRELGTCAAQLLFHKIQYPDTLSTSIYLNTEVYFRDSAPCPSAPASCSRP